MPYLEKTKTKLSGDRNQTKRKSKLRLNPYENQLYRMLRQQRLDLDSKDEERFNRYSDKEREGRQGNEETCVEVEKEECVDEAIQECVIGTREECDVVTQDECKLDPIEKCKEVTKQKCKIKTDKQCRNGEKCRTVKATDCNIFPAESCG